MLDAVRHTQSLLPGLLFVTLSASSGALACYSSPEGAHGTANSPGEQSNSDAQDASSEDNTPGESESGGDGDTGEDTGEDDASESGDPPDGESEPLHDFCDDVGVSLAMGASIFGDTGTNWVSSAAESPHNIDWSSGYMYSSADPHEDLEGFAWLMNFRLDTALQSGAELPTVTFYRMLHLGRERGIDGGESEVVQGMLKSSEAIYDYIEDFVAVLKILDERDQPILLHVEPDSWGFMMWSFPGFDGQAGNPDASTIEVNLSQANHPALQGKVFADDAGGLGQAMLYLRNDLAPKVRMGWHASNFRVGTKPEVVTEFYASMGPWDVIVTEPPNMVNNGSEPWDKMQKDNEDNLAWLRHVSDTTALPLVVWQTFAGDSAHYLGGWPTNQENMKSLTQNGVVEIMWDPNGVGSDCGYTCPEADDLLDFLSSYTSDPLLFTENDICPP